MEERCNISYYGYLAGTERIRHSENLRCMIRREEGYRIRLDWIQLQRACCHTETANCDIMERSITISRKYIDIDCDMVQTN